MEVRHLWGMTELSPLGTVGAPSPAMLAAGRKARAHRGGVAGAAGGHKGPALDPGQEALVAAKIKQGRPHALCDMRIVNDAGAPLPHDGKAVGHLQVKGPATVARYFKVSSGARAPHTAGCDAIEAA